MDYFLVAAGFVLLLLGGEFLVRGAVALARRLEVSPLIIGLTIVAYGTSAPELLVSLEAHLSGASGIAIGNVVGSNIANILLIVGCAALIRPVPCARECLRLNGPVVLGATAVLALLGLTGAVTAWVSVPMLLFLTGFTFYSYWAERKSLARGGPDAAMLLHEVEEFEDGPKSMPAIAGALAGGLFGVLLGSDFLVDGAAGLARSFGVSEATIGLTVVAIGTSLPELATSVVAALRRHSDVALGNVLGSNIFNILAIIGVLPLFGRLPIPEELARFDMWVMLGITVFFIAWATAFRRVGRPLGLLFLLGYVTYIGAEFGAL